MTTYLTISQTTTSYSDSGHGALLKCNNDTILCNTEEWLCDGSVNWMDSLPLLGGALIDSAGVLLYDSDGKRLYGSTAIVELYIDISYP